MIMHLLLSGESNQSVYSLNESSSPDMGNGMKIKSY